MAYDTSNLTIDNNYLSIEEFVEIPIEEIVQRALETLNAIEEYDDIPSISNNKGWEAEVGKRGIDTRPRFTMSRFLE